MKNESKENFIALILCIAVLGVLGMVMCFFNLVIGLVQIACAVLLALFNVLVIRKNHGSFTDFIENISFHADNATRDSLINAPMPVVIFKFSGKVLWSNEKFDALFEGVPLFDEPFESLFPTIGRDALKKGNLDFSCYIGERHFAVRGNYIYEEKKDTVPAFVVFYLFEDTVLFAHSVKYEEEKPVVGVINIDNYDDVLLNTPDAYRSLLLAEIDNKISSWFSFTNGILKKVEKDRYFLFFPHNCLQKMIDDKFSVLDSVRDIRCGNKFSATLSIGIGVGDKDYKDLDDAANSAIALSLGRGGDQAIIKENNEMRFFGGKNREHEKTTKVKARVTANALKDMFSRASNVIIMGHKLPDMDAIGAAVGLCAFARFYDKEAYILYENTSPSVNGIVNRIKENVDYSGVFISPEAALEHVHDNSLLVVVDTHKPDYTYYPPLIDRLKNIVLIDHHRRGEDFIDHAKLVYHEPYASSTCEMVAEILQYAGGDFHLAAQEAEALYAGIMLDTKDFAMKTGVRTFEAAAFLKRCGVDIQAIRKFFRNDFNSFVNIAQIVSSAIMVNGNIAVSGCEHTEGSDIYSIAPQAADKLLSISGIEASFVIMEKPDEISISGRSTGNINVQRIMEKLGGGGHLTMAGTQLKNCTYAEAKEKLLHAIDEYLKENE